MVHVAVLSKNRKDCKAFVEGLPNYIKFTDVVFHSVIRYYDLKRIYNVNFYIKLDTKPYEYKIIKEHILKNNIKKVKIQNITEIFT
jgi:hypothetical protein